MIPPTLWPWKLIGKVAGAAAVAGLLTWAFVTVKGWHDDHVSLPNVRQERDQARADTIRVREEGIVEAGRISGLYEGLRRENETLRTQRAAIPARSVRLCKASEGTPGEAVPAATTGNDGSLADAG